MRPPLKMSRRRFAGLSVLVVVTLVVAWALLPKPMVVEVATVTRGPLTATVTAEGKSRVRDLYVVTAPVDGNLQRVAVEAGDSVARGSVVARMDPQESRPLDPRSRAEAVAAVATAKAKQREAAAALTHAESLLVTARVLRDVEPGNALEHAEHEVEIRRGAADAARAELARAEAVAGTGAGGSPGPLTEIRSPVAGRVLRVVREDAGPVMAGAALLEIGNTTTLEFTSELLTADAMSVRAGATAAIRDWGAGPPIAASVRLVEPGGFTKISALGLEEQRVRVILDPVTPVPQGLGNDFHVNVSIVVWSGENVLTVPATALFRSGERWAVFTLQKGRARLKPVTTGPSDGVRTVLVDGLSEGQAVVVQPSDLVRDGTRIRGVRGAATEGR